MVQGSKDLTVIGAGFYGCMIAQHFASRGSSVTLVERHATLLAGASFRNQARVHNGYHYPRSFATAFRSHENYERFVHEFRDCVHNPRSTLYAIARFGSKTSVDQFVRFCTVAQIPLRPPHKEFARLFSPAFIAAVFEAEELTFDANRMRASLSARLESARVDVRTAATVEAIVPAPSGLTEVKVSDGESISSRTVVNCTYSDLNVLLPRDARIPGLQHEITEVCLIEPPPPLRDLAITVMDGPFFSMLPFPALGMHSLTHVRYTPHASWLEDDLPTGARGRAYDAVTRYPRMIRDSARYLPALRDARPTGSLFETKTLPGGREIDDGRPIIVSTHSHEVRVASVLGSKIDNIYDALPQLEAFIDAE